MDVSIIIVNYNTTNLIKNCVESILDHTSGISYEVIIVDNNSEPDFQAKIRESIPQKNLHNFHFMPLPENIGFGRANNEGLKISTGRNILFLNPDTVLINNAIKILSDFLDNNPKAGACGGNLYDENMQPAHSFRRLFPGIRTELNDLLNAKPLKLYFGKNYCFNNTNHPLLVSFIIGADLMIKKEVLDFIGPFSPDFFMYYEETDLCYRIKKEGWKIYSVPSAKINHLESKSFSETDAYESEFKTRLLEESRHIFYKRNKSKLNKKIADFLFSFLLFTRIKLIKEIKKKTYYETRRKYFKQTK